MRKRRLLLTTGASLATMVLTMGTAMADPVPVPMPIYPPVVIIGAQTTQDLFDTLCNNNTSFRTNPSDPDTRLCQSWDVNPQPSNITTRPSGCTVARPKHGEDGTGRLIAFPACVDVARVVANDSATRPPGFTYIELATDVLSYAIRGNNSIVPPNLTNAELRSIYTCDPNFVFNKVTGNNPRGIQPLVGYYGSDDRTLLFRLLNITDTPNYTDPGQLGECITDRDANGIGLKPGDGRVLINGVQIITYSAASWLAQVFKVAPDIHGASILGSINGRNLAVVNDANTYAIRGDNTTVPPDLNVAELKAIYSCDPTITFPSNLSGLKPLLTPFGVGNRTSFLTKLGLADSANYTTLNPCVHDTPGSGADDGRVLTDPKHLINYSPAPWLSQILKVAPDIHGAAVLGSTNRISPAVVDSVSFGTRTVFNVVRTAGIAGGNIRDLFVGTGSKVCSDSADIKRGGFNVLPGTTPNKTCGDTSLVSN